jgi:branched-chain amino acid transport system substrate-binding protein
MTNEETFMMRIRLLTLLTAFVLIAAACSSDSGSGDVGAGGESAPESPSDTAPDDTAPDDTAPDDTAPDGTAPDNTAPEATPPPQDTVPAPTGDPVKIGVTTSEGLTGLDLSGFREGAQVAAEYLNAERGGVLGRPVEIVACNDEGDPSTSRACGQEFVDEGVVAVMAFSPLWGANGLPLTSEAEIPYVGQPIDFTEYIDPTTRPFYGGSVTSFPPMVEYITERFPDANRVSILYADVDAGELAANALIGDPLRGIGFEVDLVPESIGAPDFTTAVAAATASNPDVMFALFSTDDCARILDAMLGLAAEVPLANAGCDISNLSDGDLDRLVLIETAAFDWRSDTDDAAEYKAAVAAYGEGRDIADLADGFAQLIATVDAITEVGEIGPASLLEFLRTTTDFDVFMSTTLDTNDCVSLLGVDLGVCLLDQRVIVTENGVQSDAGRWYRGL